MAERSRTGCVCLSKRLRPCAPRSGKTSSSAAVSWRKSASRAATARGNVRPGRRLRDRRDGFRFDFAWRKVQDAGRPAVMRLPVPIQGRAAAYPYTGQSGYECMSQFISDARGLFGRNAAPTRVIRNASWGVWHAGRLHGWRAQLRNGGELARGGSLRRRRRSAVVPRRSRRDAKDLARPRRGSAHLRVHELLRGARSKTQGGYLPTLGQAQPRRRRDTAYDGRKAAARRAGLDSRVM